MADPTQPGAGVNQATQQALDLNDVILAIESSTKSIAETFKSIDLSNIKNFTMEINGATKEWVENVKSVSSEFRKELETLSLLSQDQQQLQIGGLLANQYRSISAHYSKQEVENAEKELELADSMFTKLKRNMEFWNDQLDRIAPKTRSAYKSMDQAAMAMSQPASLPGQLLSAMPGSGILSFFVMGMSQGEKWRSMTEQVVQSFDRMGGGGDKFAGKFQGYIKSLTNDLIGSQQTLIAINTAFATAGVTADQAWGDKGVVGTLGNVGNSLGEVSMKFDMLMEAAPGTSAQLIGTAFSQFGTTLQGASKAIVEYGMAARNARVDAVGFVNTLMQNSESLKLYGIQLDSVAEATMRVFEANKAAGMTNQYAMNVGQAGMGQVTGGLASIAPGLAAVIGQTVSSALNSGGKLTASDEFMKWTGNGSAFGIMMQMRQGFRSAPEEERGRFMGESIKAMYDVAMKATGGKVPEAQYFLEKMGFGLEGARTILQIGSDPTKQGKPLSKEDQAALMSAQEKEAQKTSNMDKSLQYLVTAVGEIANGLLGMILAGIKVIVDGVMLWKAKMFGSSDEVSMAQARLANTQAAFGESFRTMGEGVGHLGTSIKNFGKSAPGWQRLLASDEDLDPVLAARIKEAQKPKSTFEKPESHVPAGYVDAFREAKEAARDANKQPLVLKFSADEQDTVVQTNADGSITLTKKYTTVLVPEDKKVGSKKPPKARTGH